MVSDKKKEQISKECGKLLVDLINDESPGTAYIEFRKKVATLLGIKMPPRQRKSKSLKERGVRKVKRNCEKIKKLFIDIVTGEDLIESEILDEFIFCYRMPDKPYIEFGDDDSLVVEKATTFFYSIDKVISYCVVTFLESAENRKRLGICKECGTIFFADRIGQIYCKRQCCQKYNNRKYIKSGKAKEYKRKKRAEGATPSYYG
jgi:hypothetical protein